MVRSPSRVGDAEVRGTDPPLAIKVAGSGRAVVYDVQVSDCPLRRRSLPHAADKSASPQRSYHHDRLRYIHGALRK